MDYEAPPRSAGISVCPIRFVEIVVSALSEKSLLVAMGLTLGLIITWLITSDPNNTALQAHGTNLVGINAPLIADSQ